jgi:hypothetical protein
MDDDGVITRLTEQGLLFHDEDGVLLFRHGVAKVTDPYDVVLAAIQSLDVSVDKMIQAIRGGAEQAP